MAWLRSPIGANVIRGTALITLGHVRARRGDPDAWPALDDALAIAREAADTAKLAPLAVARVEAAALGGNRERALGELAGFDPGDLADRWIAGELACWARRLAGVERDPGDVPLDVSFAVGERE